MSLYGSPQLKKSVDNQRGQSFRGMNSVIQGTKAAVNTGATGAIVHGTQDAFSGNRAKAISEYQSVPGQLWQGLERDPIGGAVTIAAGFGIGGSILDTGAAIATKVADLDAAIGYAQESGDLSAANALQARQAIARNIASKLSQNSAQAHYYATGGAPMAAVRGSLNNLISKAIVAARSSSGPVGGVTAGKLVGQVGPKAAVGLHLLNKFDPQAVSPVFDLTSRNTGMAPTLYKQPRIGAPSGSTVLRESQPYPIKNAGRITAQTVDGNTVSKSSTGNILSRAPTNYN